MLHFIRVTLFLLPFGQVTLFLCCTFFMLHFSSSTLFMLNLFKCCAFYTLRLFFVLLHVALTSCCNVLRCTRFVMHFFQVALFLFCTLFVLQFFRLALFSSRDHPQNTSIKYAKYLTLIPLPLF